MKTKQFVKKLSLQKATVVNLGSDQMQDILGGTLPETLILPLCGNYTLKYTNCLECPTNP